jgi:hypothetical protein
MSRCFVSYRHVSPDQELAHALNSRLALNGHSVFVDSKMRVGARWVEQIEGEIRAADFFIVLLSEQSVKSDMVRQEVAIAHGLAADGKLQILPVRVAYTGRLPYDFAAYLNPIQHCVWQEGEAYERVCTELEAAINNGNPASIEPAICSFEPGSLDRLAEELANYVGPVARVLVNRAAHKASNWKQLYEALAQEVPTGPERRDFLAKHHLS